MTLCPDRRTPSRREGGRRGSLGVLLLAGAVSWLSLPSPVPGFAPPAPGAGQGQEAAPPLPSPGVPTAYLVTVGPGRAVWERFGHNLIWIHDPDEGGDPGYNYGLFSFEQENFFLNFVRGRMRYWMQGWDVRAQIEAYASQGRAIWIQELALEPERVGELQAFLEWNERPENRFYRYDYFWDNCSTRVRDALDRVLEGRLRAELEEVPTGETFRDHTLRATEPIFWAWGWLHFAMGPMTDRDLSAWEAAFIPMELQAHLRDFSIGGADGASLPLVRDEWTQVEGRHPAKADTTLRRLGSFGAVGIAVALLIGLLGARARKGEGRARITFGLLALPWLLFWGALGTLITLMWAFTDHVVATGNLNLLHANALHLAVALLPGGLTGRPGRVARFGRRLALVAGLVSGAALVAQLLLPGLVQVNGEFLALLVPANLALAREARRAMEEEE